MGTLTAIQIVTEAAGRIGVTPPTSVVAVTDSAVTWKAALNSMAQNVLGLHDWTDCNFAVQFVGTAISNQGMITTIAPGFLRYVPDSMMNITRRIFCNGPIAIDEYEMLSNLTLGAGVLDSFVFRGQDLHIYPAPNGTDNYRFSFIRSYVWGTAGSGTKTYLTADADVWYLDDELAITGTAYAWKLARGLEYGAEEASFNTRLGLTTGADGGRRSVSLRRPRNMRPGIYFPLFVP